MNDDYVLPRCLKQTGKKICKGVHDVHLEESEEIKYGIYKSDALRQEEADTELDEKSIEDEFWMQIEQERYYATDNPMSLFGDAKVWNLDQFTRDESNIHSKPSHRTLKVSDF